MYAKGEIRRGEPAVTVSRSSLGVEQVAEAFSGPIGRVWISPLYLLGLLITAATMILLPLLYLGLIGLAGYGTWYHATEHITVLQPAPAGGVRTSLYGYITRAVVYAGPLLGGVVLILFMIKPLFARAPLRERRISVVRDREPVLFAFVDHLCETVGAPKPRRIDVTCEINASASFRKGFLSFLGRDLVLTIGAPLMAGLSLREFAGVLAHEFGHFSQGVGMRLTYIIRRINGWFARVVYQRDAWDDKLIELSRQDEWYISLTFLLARFFVWVTRRILWVLMTLGHMISCGMLRQLEYNADRYAMRVAGSAAMESGLRRVHLLGAAWQAVHADLYELWKDGRLADNLPALVAAKAGEIPQEWQEAIDQQLEEGRTGLFDTHPSEAARFGAARREAAPGVFEGEGPAWALFHDFSTFCKAVTLPYYQDLVGSPVMPDKLISTAQLTARQAAMARGETAAARYFHNALNVLRPLRVDRHSAIFGLPARDCMARLNQARGSLQAAADRIQKLDERYRAAYTRLMQLELAHVLQQSGVRIDPEEFNLSAITPGAIGEARSEAQAALRAVDQKLGLVDGVLGTRLECGLALLADESLQERLPGADRLRRRSHQLLGALRAVHQVADDLNALRRQQPSLRAMETLVPENPEDDMVINQAIQIVESQHRQLVEIRGLLREESYPFPHAEGRISLARYALDKLPNSDNLTGTRMATDRLLDHIESLYLRIMGELALVAEQVEGAVAE